MADNIPGKSAEVEALERNVPENLHPVVETIVKYQKQIALGVGAIILIAAITGGLNWYNGKQKAKIETELGTILVTTKGAEKIKKLEALLADAPSSAQPAIRLEMAAEFMNSGDYAKAEPLWNELAGETDTATRDTARLGKAKCLMGMKKFAEAIKILDDLAATVGDAFTTPVYRQLAYAAEQAGDKKAALAAFEKLATQSVPDKPFVEAKVAQLKGQ